MIDVDCVTVDRGLQAALRIGKATSPHFRFLSSSMDEESRSAVDYVPRTERQIYKPCSSDVAKKKCVEVALPSWKHTEESPLGKIN